MSQEDEPNTFNLRGRCAAEVFEDHLRLDGEHRFAEDIERNTSPDIVIMERRGIFRGREGAKELRVCSNRNSPRHPTCTRTG